jgi:hypothetical protein
MSSLNSMKLVSMKLVSMKSKSVCIDPVVDTNSAGQALFDFAIQFISESQNQFQVLGCVHSLTVPKNSSAPDIIEINRTLGRAYQQLSCPVLGGDTLSGQILSITITLIGTLTSA